MNVYDFDKTIYNGDASFDFYLYILKRYKKLIIIHLPIVLYTFALYLFKIKNKKDVKESVFKALKKIDNVEIEVKNFWQVGIKKVNKFYIDLHDEKDLVISASPYFLLKPICDILNIGYLIATDVNIYTGKINGNNCVGVEKVKRFEEEFPEQKINNFYTDSLSDLPLIKISKNSYIVKNGIPISYNKDINN